ncbi:hypothetical protein [Nocardioides zeae]|uniref:Uncharacterized protein n=1 Tax=Nocardioides zeae TaxID=1457234 RepID=A0A6P0HM79_9ACTN|nr:hypothetical protein [Nocardioides zeae]NEN79696.1 hypothetical protein [Nocardioides zeae]
MTTPTPTSVTTSQNRNAEMQLLNEELARAQSAELLREAEQRHQVQRLLAARRLSLRAEAAAQQVRLKLARSL